MICKPAQKYTQEETAVAVLGAKQVSSSYLHKKTVRPYWPTVFLITYSGI